MENETINPKPTLTEKTIFFCIDFNRFGNSRKVDVEAKTTAEQNRFSHNKRLLNSPELTAVANADAGLRIWLDQPNRCWKYGKSSMRVLSFDQVDEVYNRCTEYQEVTRPALIEKFLAVYLEQIAEAQKDLGPQFNLKDYPTVEQVRAEFAMSFCFPTFETDSKLKLISPKVYALAVEKANQTLVFAAEEIREGMRALYKMYVDKILDTISPSSDGKKKKLHASLITKLQDALNSFNLRNVTDDAELQVEVQKMKLIMSGIDADKIRESDTLKVDLVAKFSEVSGNLTNLVEVKGRKIR